MTTAALFLASAACEAVLGMQAPITTGPCTTSADCAPTERCVASRCHMACRTQADCPAATRCEGPAGGAVCASTVCPATMADCNEDPADGCETNLSTDPANCGRCNSACDSMVCEGATCLVTREWGSATSGITQQGVGYSAACIAGKVCAVSMFVEMDSWLTALEFVATTAGVSLYVGLYRDDADHPGELVAQGLRVTTPGLNVVPVTPPVLTKGGQYWEAVVGDANVVFTGAQGKTPWDAAPLSFGPLPQSFPADSVTSTLGNVPQFGILCALEP